MGKFFNIVCAEVVVFVLECQRCILLHCLLAEDKEIWLSSVKFYAVYTTYNRILGDSCLFLTYLFVQECTLR